VVGFGVDVVLDRDSKLSSSLAHYPSRDPLQFSHAHQVAEVPDIAGKRSELNVDDLLRFFEFVPDCHVFDLLGKSIKIASLAAAVAPISARVTLSITFSPTPHAGPYAAPVKGCRAKIPLWTAIGASCDLLLTGRSAAISR
jgi:hypothetical protein